MSVSSLTNLSSVVSAAVQSDSSQSNVQQTVQLTLERQANSIQSSGALALLQAIPQYSNPSNLGNGVDVQA